MPGLCLPRPTDRAKTRSRAFDRDPGSRFSRSRAPVERTSGRRPSGHRRCLIQPGRARHRPHHLQGLRRPRPLRRPDRRGRGLPRRPRVRPRAGRHVRHRARRAAPGAGARHAPAGPGPGRALRRRHGRRGRVRAGRGPGGHRDALLDRRVAGAGRRPDVHRLAQPEGVHGREARGPRRAGAVRRRRHRRAQGHRHRRRAGSRRGLPRRDQHRGHRRALPRRRAGLHRHRRRCARARWCWTAATAWRARWPGRSWTRCRSSRSRCTGPRTARCPTTSPTRCSRRTASSSSTRSGPRAPSWASPGTGTPTAASSSTATATSWTGTS